MYLKRRDLLFKHGSFFFPFQREKREIRKENKATASPTASHLQPELLMQFGLVKKPFAVLARNGLIQLAEPGLAWSGLYQPFGTDNNNNNNSEKTATTPKSHSNIAKSQIRCPTDLRAKCSLSHSTAPTRLWARVAMHCKP